jgi:predicted esterase
MFRAAVTTLLIIAGGMGQPKMATPRSPRTASLLSNQQTSEIPRGKIIENLICLIDATQSYALYLPSSYTPARKWPILYAFDPGARGQIPVERFKAAAEKYGWVVAGSNNSRNGAFQPSVDAWNAIVKDTHDRLAIDDARVYVAGFSGGARLAIRLARLCNDCVAGVIACGAGFPSGVIPSSANRFLFFGTAGFEDFNFPELNNLDQQLTKAGLAHRIRAFDGRHEWAPADVATEAVEWMELNAMNGRKRPRDGVLVESIWQKQLQQAQELEDSKRFYEAYQTYAGMVETFKGLRDVDGAEKKAGQLRDNRAVTEAINDEQRQIKKQRDLERQIDALIAARGRADNSEESSPPASGGPPDINAPQDKSVPLDPGTRLEAIIADLRKQSRAAADSSDRRIARRVLEGLYVGLFEQGVNQLQTQKLFRAAVNTFKFASEVNPDRAGAFFYLAWAHAANGDKKKSLQALKSAVDKGFTDLAAIADNKAFDSIHNDPQYQQVIEILKNKH